MPKKSARTIIWLNGLRLLRPHQWLKNLLVFVPAFTAHWFDAITFQKCLLAFLSFSLCASSGYIFNDLRDIETDRDHQTNRHRPLASGAIKRNTAWFLLVLTLGGAIAIATQLTWKFSLTLGIYYALTIFYSLSLKRTLITDTLTLACLYGLRLAAGAVTVGVILSQWLLCFSIFLFLSLALIKRTAELIARKQHNRSDPPGRGYRLTDIPMLESMAAASGYVAALTSGLYVNSEIVTQLYANREFLWILPVFILFWISRILILTHRGEMHDDPVLFAARDRTSLLCGLLMIGVVLLSI